MSDEPVTQEVFENRLRSKGFQLVKGAVSRNLEDMVEEPQRMWFLAHMCGHCPNTHLAIVSFAEEGGVAYELVMPVKEAEALAAQLLNPKPTLPEDIT